MKSRHIVNQQHREPFSVFFFGGGCIGSEEWFFMSAVIIVVSCTHSSIEDVYSTAPVSHVGLLPEGPWRKEKKSVLLWLLFLSPPLASVRLLTHCGKKYKFKRPLMAEKNIHYVLSSRVRVERVRACEKCGIIWSQWGIRAPPVKTCFATNSRELKKHISRSTRERKPAALLLPRTSAKKRIKRGKVHSVQSSKNKTSLQSK